MNWNEVLLNIIISIVAAGIFWFISFKFSRTKIIFSDNLIKSNAIRPGGYRIKIANVGKRDLIEVTVVAKLKIKINNSTQDFFLDITGTGTQTFITILAGMKLHKKDGRSNYRILTLFAPKSSQKRLKKIMNVKNNKKIQLQDIFERYGKSVEITVYVYGNDRTIGTRKVFESKNYTTDDLINDDAYKFEKVDFSRFDRAKTKQNKISRVSKT